MQIPALGKLMHEIVQATRVVTDRVQETGGASNVSARLCGQLPTPPGEDQRRREHRSQQPPADTPGDHRGGMAIYRREVSQAMMPSAMAAA